MKNSNNKVYTWKNFPMNVLEIEITFKFSASYRCTYVNMNQWHHAHSLSHYMYKYNMYTK